MMIAVSMMAAVFALVANYPNAAAVAFAFGAVWAIEAALVAKAGRELSRARGWAAPLIALCVAMGLLLLISWL